MKTTNKELARLAEAYFDCTLTEAEEERLRQLLAQSSETTGIIGEAHAVMGIFSTERIMARKRKSQARNLRVMAWAAAAVAIAVLVIPTLLKPAQSDADCIMYAEGRVITGEKEVLAQIDRQMAEVRQQSSSVDDIVQSQLGDFKALLAE